MMARMARDAVLTEAEVADRLTSHPAWEVVDGRLHRELTFTGFRQAFGFMAQVALAAERLDHHPDWSNSWNRVVVDITNHDAGGLSARCFELAAAVDDAADASG